MEIPKLVIKVENDVGTELVRAEVPGEIAGAFLEYLGSQLRGLRISKAPTQLPPRARKAGEES